ncbi:MAG: hypothetical protein JJE02_04980 [Propionibacteriales bacterium]|nr:hypothetical protein [Propionibacteriales bacterium]
MAHTRPKRRYFESSPFKPPAEEPVVVFEVGARVSHDSYGLGRIVSVQNTSSVQVDFGTHTRHVALPCKKLLNL